MKKIIIETRIVLARTKYRNFRYQRKLEYRVSYDGKIITNTDVANPKIPFDRFETRSKKSLNDYINTISNREFKKLLEDIVCI